MVLLSFYGLAAAQLREQLNFSTLTEKDGLSNKKINSITQDKNGVMWMGSSNGLNRFDGSRVKTYYSSDAGIPFGEIKFLYATARGIWICTISQVFYLQTGSEKTWLLGKFTNAVVYKQGTSFKLADREYIYQLPDEGAAGLTNFIAKPLLKRPILEGVGNHIIHDQHQQPWTFRLNKILRLKRDSYSVEKEYSWHGREIQMIFFDRENRCWVATWGDGVFLFDPNTGAITQFDIEDNKFVALGFTSWQQAGENFIVLASDNSMIVIDEKKLSYQKFSQSHDRYRLNAGFSDKENNLWLACEDGVRLVSKRQDLFHVVPIAAPSAAPTSGWVSGVYSIRETSNHYWLSKRYLSGIFQYDKSWHLVKYWSQLAPEKTDFYQKNSSEAYDFMEADGRVYITTELGIYVKDPTAGLKLFSPAMTGNLLPRLRNIEKQNDSTWWIRSYSNGIYLFNPRAEKFIEHFELKDKRSTPLQAHFMLRTKMGKLFLSTYDGLYQMNGPGKFDKVEIVEAPSEYMLGMAEDKKGILWIATSNGMFGFDPASKKIINKLSAFGEMGFCYRVAVDEYDNVWFNCQKGFWCWVQSKGQMLKFGYDMGLPDNRLEAGITRGVDGRIYAGANDAVVIFDPAVIMKYATSALAIITDVSVDQTRTTTSVVSDSSQQLKLPPGRHNLQVNFSVTDYTTPGNYELFYKISPGNASWAKAENGAVNFSSLEQGSYEIVVVGSNNLTGSFSKPHYLFLTIRPHWYQTLSFKIALLLCIIGITSFLLKRRIKQVRRSAHLKQKIAESEMSVLRSQMNPHFIFNSLNSIENFILQNEKRQASDYLIKFSKLIRTILEINQLQLIPFYKDMEALSWYLELEQIRFPKKFDVRIKIDPLVQTKNSYVPPMIVQPFIENAIVHGIAQSREDGHVLSISVRLEGEYLLYLIEDDGIGMEKSVALNKLNKPGHKSVGLQITKERIRLHNNSIEDEDVIFRQGNPAGTIVIIKIKIKSHGESESNISG
ncbi:MAG: hypothetical protein EOO06_01980 [Chitinophagaceae bacterium]|nr:MAG: hypothetical protein EOO06_01980 [Chitinophagaceae bacterium]